MSFYALKLRPYSLLACLCAFNISGGMSLLLFFVSGLDDIFWWDDLTNHGYAHGN